MNSNSMTRHLEREGVVFDAGDQTNLLAEYLSGDPLPALLEQAKRRGLKLIYTYDMQQQGEDRNRQDGETFKNVSVDGKRIWYAIGLSLQALLAGREYTVLIFLHELTHVLLMTGDHTPGFHRYLDYLLHEYNRANGTTIKNDYYGLDE